MAELHNKIDKRILKEQIQSSTEERKTISFYQYAHILDPDTFRDTLYHNLVEIGVMGRIYVAREGVNAQISVPTQNLNMLKEVLDATGFLKGIRLNIAVDDDGKSFYKLIIKVKHKILADGLNDDTFDVTKKGKHLNAQEFNDLMEQSDSIVIDMRNHYETEVGHFEGAICPDVDTFRDSLPIIVDFLKENHEDKNIMMYCTGGIRCEKASAYFKHIGFEKVFQLEGGIIKYANDCEKEGIKNKFIGKNFVFDDRLGERISEEVIAQCHQCGKPCDNHTNCKNDACHILFIQCEECANKYESCCSNLCKDFTHLPEEVQKEIRSGMDIGRQVFKKGRFELNAGNFWKKIQDESALKLLKQYGIEVQKS